MSSSSDDQFCTEDEGLDYVFAKMAAIYGAAFYRHWEGSDPTMVRDTWKDLLGRFLTYRPSMDYALRHMDGDFPPSALAFREICQKGPGVPRKGQEAIGYEAQAQSDPLARQRGREAMAALRQKLGIGKALQVEGE